MRCLLISLQENVHIIGLKYIASSIIRAGYDSRILILPGYREKGLLHCITDFIKEYRPDLIGLSLLSTEFLNSVRLTELLHQSFSIPIIWGGVHVSLYPEECLRYADYICIGEGEQAIVSLMDHLRHNGPDRIPDIPGIWTNREDKTYWKERHSSSTDLNMLPSQEYMPDYIYCLHRGAIYNLKQHPEITRIYSLYKGKAYITTTTRGCPMSCGYCVNAYLADTFRERPVEHCIEELKDVKAHHTIKYISFEDDCFFLHSRGWIEKFAEEYRRHVKLPFILKANPLIIDRVKLMTLKDAGLIMVVMDIRSCSDRINREFFQRSISHSYLILLSQILSDLRVSTTYDIYKDNPLEDEKDRIDVIDIISSLKRPFILHTTPFTPIHGTPLKDMLVASGLEYGEKTEYPYLDKLLSLTPYLPQFLTRYLNRPSAERNMLHSLLLDTVYLITKLIAKPLIDFFTIARANHYNPARTVKTILLRLNADPLIS